jgi:hypothetical protein
MVSRPAKFYRESPIRRRSNNVRRRRIRAGDLSYSGAYVSSMCIALEAGQHGFGAAALAGQPQQIRDPQRLSLRARVKVRIQA